MGPDVMVQFRCGTLIAVHVLTVSNAPQVTGDRSVHFGEFVAATAAATAPGFVQAPSASCCG